MRHQVLDHPGDDGGKTEDEAIAGVTGGDKSLDVVVREKHLEAAEDKGSVDSKTKHICVRFSRWISVRRTNLAEVTGSLRVL